jgi:hypothetical protein
MTPQVRAQALPHNSRPSAEIHIHVDGRQVSLSLEEALALATEIRKQARPLVRAREEAAGAAARREGHLYVAHYRLGTVSREKEFACCDEAVAFLAEGEWWGRLTADAVEGPGSLALSGELLRGRLRDYERAKWDLDG